MTLIRSIYHNSNFDKSKAHELRMVQIYGLCLVRETNPSYLKIYKKLLIIKLFKTKIYGNYSNTFTL